MLNKFRRIFHTPLPAFSLLEISIVLLIMGVILSFSLPYLSNHLDFEKRKKTDLVFEEVTHALSTFVMETGRLPAPANPHYNPDSAGEEDETITTGILPYKTLGLSPSMAKDGHSHWISYTPHPTLSEEGALTKSPHGDEDDNFCNVDLRQTIQVFGEGEETLTAAGGSQPAFILVSHGKRGGDFMDSGVRRPYIEAVTCKTSNGDGDLVFRDEGLTKSCDDKIFWKNRKIMLSAYARNPCAE